MEFTPPRLAGPGPVAGPVFANLAGRHFGGDVHMTFFQQGECPLVTQWDQPTDPANIERLRHLSGWQRVYLEVPADGSFSPEMPVGVTHPAKNVSEFFTLAAEYDIGLILTVCRHALGDWSTGSGNGYHARDPIMDPNVLGPFTADLLRWANTYYPDVRKVVGDSNEFGWLKSVPSSEWESWFHYYEVGLRRICRVVDKHLFGTPVFVGAANTLGDYNSKGQPVFGSWVAKRIASGSLQAATELIVDVHGNGLSLSELRYSCLFMAKTGAPWAMLEDSEYPIAERAKIVKQYGGRGYGHFAQTRWVGGGSRMAGIERPDGWYEDRFQMLRSASIELGSYNGGEGPEPQPEPELDRIRDLAELLYNRDEEMELAVGVGDPYRPRCLRAIKAVEEWRQ